MSAAIWGFLAGAPFWIAIGYTICWYCWATGSDGES